MLLIAQAMIPRLMWYLTPRLKLAAVSDTAADLVSDTAITDDSSDCSSSTAQIISATIGITLPQLVSTQLILEQP